MTTMKAALYFPILRAKRGEIDAVSHFSPHARTRIRPMFDVQKQKPMDDTPAEVHLSELSRELAQSWGTAMPLFIDFSLFGPEDRLLDERLPVDFFFECLHQLGMLGIPVTGPEFIRGPGSDYLDAVARIAQHDGRGAALRMPYAEMRDVADLRQAIDDTLGILRLPPTMVDVYIDFESLVIPERQFATRTGFITAAVEAIEVLKSDNFRNVIVCGSSVPESVGKEYDWNSLRVERTEFVGWQDFQERFHPLLIKFGDYGVTFARERDADKPVKPPGRIRLSTEQSHVLWRAPRENYLQLCERVVASPDFDPNLDAWGMTILHQCARYGRGKGGPTQWVARDTNLHAELTLRSIEVTLRRSGLLSEVNFAAADVFPWNQMLIDATE